MLLSMLWDSESGKEDGFLKKSLEFRQAEMGRKLRRANADC